MEPTLLLPLLGSLAKRMLLLDAPPPVDVGSSIQQYVSQFSAETTSVLAIVQTAAIDIARAAYVTLLLLGVLLYFSHLSRRLGRDFMTGGIMLVVILEFVVPVIMRL